MSKQVKMETKKKFAAIATEQGAMRHMNTFVQDEIDAFGADRRTGTIKTSDPSAELEAEFRKMLNASGLGAHIAKHLKLRIAEYDFPYVFSSHSSVVNPEADTLRLASGDRDTDTIYIGKLAAQYFSRDTLLAGIADSILYLKNRGGFSFPIEVEENMKKIASNPDALLNARDEHNSAYRYSMLSLIRNQVMAFTVDKKAKAIKTCEVPADLTERFEAIKGNAHLGDKKDVKLCVVDYAIPFILPQDPADNTIYIGKLASKFFSQDELLAGLAYAVSVIEKGGKVLTRDYYALDRRAAELTGNREAVMSMIEKGKEFDRLLKQGMGTFNYLEMALTSALVGFMGNRMPAAYSRINRLKGGSERRTDGVSEVSR